MMNAKGYAAFSANTPLKTFNFERRDPRPNDVVIEIKFAGICHSDIGMAKNHWGEVAKFPFVPGHEIAGIVIAIGESTTKFKIGDRVGVGCLVDTCRECPHCAHGFEQYCVTGGTLTYSSIDRVDGSITQGGYSNMIVVDQDFVVKVPDAVSLEKAAPLLCAGITTYSPLKHWNAGPGKKVGIVGLGGLGHLAVKFAVALGAEVTVLSHSDKKRNDSKEMGAHHFVSTHDPEAFSDNALTLDLIINTVGVDIDINPYFGLLKLDGAMVAVGMPPKPQPVMPFILAGARRSYSASLIGSIAETQEMMNFCAEKNIGPEIELIEPKQINEAFERVMKSDVRYRFVIDNSKL